MAKIKVESEIYSWQCEKRKTLDRPWEDVVFDPYLEIQGSCFSINSKYSYLVDSLIINNRT